MKQQKSMLSSGDDINGHSFCAPYLDYVSRDIVLDEATKTLIAQNCQLVKFAKGEQLLKIGNVCQYVYFIVEGECISYLTDFNGKTTTWFFHFNRPESIVKNIFAVDYKSFLLRQPATLSIETLSAVTAIRFSFEAVNSLMVQSPAFERWLRLVNERAIIHIYDRINTLLTLSATDRYQKLLKEEPFLLNMFSNYLIASYLHVAPPSLSRIKKRIRFI
jgi:CRP-like cAMP-binding protein